MPAFEGRRQSQARISADHKVCMAYRAKGHHTQQLLPDSGREGLSLTLVSGHLVTLHPWAAREVPAVIHVMRKTVEMPLRRPLKIRMTYGSAGNNVQTHYVVSVFDTTFKQ